MTVQIILFDGDHHEDVTEGVLTIFDALCGSMDYGSGFLSTDEMDALANLATAIKAGNAVEVRAKLREAKWSGLKQPHIFVPDEGNYCLECGVRQYVYPYNHGPRPAEDERGRDEVLQRIATETRKVGFYLHPDLLLSEAAILAGVRSYTPKGWEVVGKPSARTLTSKIDNSRIGWVEVEVQKFGK